MRVMNPEMMKKEAMKKKEKKEKEVALTRQGRLICLQSTARRASLSLHHTHGASQ